MQNSCSSPLAFLVSIISFSLRGRVASLKSPSFVCSPRERSGAPPQAPLPSVSFVSIWHLVQPGHPVCLGRPSPTWRRLLPFCGCFFSSARSLATSLSSSWLRLECRRRVRSDSRGGTLRRSCCRTSSAECRLCRALCGRVEI